MNIAALTAIRTVLGPMTSEAKCREVYEAVLLSVREPSSTALLAGCQHDLPAIFKHGLMGLPGDGEGTRKQMAAVATSVAVRHRKVIDALLAE